MESLFEEHRISSRPSIIRNIVVGFDFDDLSRQALLTAFALAGQYKAHIYLVHATLPPSYASFVPDLGSFLEQLLKDTTLRIQETVTADPSLRAAPCDIVVDIKTPFQLLRETAYKHSADLVVVGSHGRHGLEQLVVGSVAESLLTSVVCPVVVIGPECGPPALPWKRILFATDLSDTGFSAADYAVSLATHNDGELSILHVMPKAASHQSDLRTWHEDETRERLARLFEPKLMSNLSCKFLIAYGDAVEEILAVAHSQKADVLVLGVGVHSIGADHNPRRTIARILREAHCPVVSVSSVP